MGGMKLSVSLPEADVAVLDDCASAWDEWETTGERGAWEGAVRNGPTMNEVDEALRPHLKR